MIMMGCKMTKGKITISHLDLIKEADGWIRIEIRYDDKILQADVDLNTFSKALTGVAMQPCDIVTYNKISLTNNPD